MKVSTGTRVWPVHRNVSDGRMWCAPPVKLTRDVPVAPNQVISTPLGMVASKDSHLIVKLSTKTSVIGFLVQRAHIR
jgi:hypothetical protein